MKDGYSKQLAEQLNTVRGTVATKLQYMEGLKAELEKSMANAQQQQIAGKVKTREYNDAKTRYLQASRIYEAMATKLATEQPERNIDFEPARIWEPAEPALYPAKPRVPAYMALAAMVGLVIGVGLAFFIEYLDTSVKTLDDVERYLQIPVLAVIPKDISMLIKTHGRHRRCRGLPHPAGERGIQQTGPRREHLHADQRRSRRRQIHDAQQPRLTPAPRAATTCSSSMPICAGPRSTISSTWRTTSA